MSSARRLDLASLGSCMPTVPGPATRSSHERHCPRIAVTRRTARWRSCTTSPATRALSRSGPASRTPTSSCWIDLNPGPVKLSPGLPLPLTERPDRGCPTRHCAVGPCRQCLYKWAQESRIVSHSKPYT
jgi:hypothetical protein